MEVTFKKAFSLIDGRLSTEIEDVIEMLNFIFSDNLMPHQLYIAIRKLKEVNPDWLSESVFRLNSLKLMTEDNFESIIKFMDEKGFSEEIIILEKIDQEIPFI